MKYDIFSLPRLITSGTRRRQDESRTLYITNLFTTTPVPVGSAYHAREGRCYGPSQIGDNIRLLRL